MTTRIVQAGEGSDRDLVVVYYLAEQIDPRLRAAAPGACIVNDTRANPAEYGSVGGGGVKPLGDLKTWVETSLGFRVRTVTIVGYSAGCKALRSLLLRSGGSDIDAVVPIDGTHASYPKPNEVVEVDPWRDFAEQARAGRKVFFATHTMLTYVEKLPRPYMSTWNVLRRVTGFPLDRQGPNETPVESRDGNLRVWSYGAADAAGHRFQGQHALPAALADAVAAVRSAAQTTRPTTPPAPSDDEESWHDPGKTPGQRALEWSFAQMRADMREVPPGSNGGPFVASVLAPCVRDGVGKLGLKTGNWCAAFACAASANSHIEGDPPLVHQYRASGFELEVDAKRSGAWRPIEVVRSGKWEPEPGDIMTIDRSGSSGEKWRRHVVRFLSWSAYVEGRFQTIGGNESDGIRVTEHHTSEPAILGFVEIPKREPTRDERSVEVVSDAARLLALSDAVMRGEGDDIEAILARIDERNDGDDAA